MVRREVWVTGVGMISSLGIGMDEVWGALAAGRTGCAPLGGEAALAVGCVAGAPVKGFRSARMIPNRKSLKLMTRPVQFGVAAAALAFEDAGLEVGAVDPERLGVFVGAGQAFADRDELQFALDKSRGQDGQIDMARFGAEGMPLIHPLWLLRGLSNNVLGFVSLEYNAQGINNNYANSGVSSIQAIASAADAIAEGRADLSFAGGYDAATMDEFIIGHGRLGLLASGPGDPALAHRPFDRARSGLVPGEGGCFLILEAAEHATARGKRGIARISGGGITSDAFAVADANPDGTKQRRAASEAMRQAKIEPGDVGAIFAHGTATQGYDPVEIGAYRALFGARLGQIPLTADKAGLGHTMSACGAMSAAVAARAVDVQRVPPIASLQEVAPECEGPDFVAGSDRAATFEHALVSSAGLGGQAAALIVSRVR